MAINYNPSKWENGKTILKASHFEKIEKGITDIINYNNSIYTDEDIRKENEIRREEEHNKKIREVTTLVDDLKSDYDALEKIIIDENASANLQNQINDVASQLEHNVNKVSEELTLRGVDILNPKNGLSPCICDGVTDDSDNLQAIIDYASLKGLKVLLPSKKIKINKTITLPLGSVIEGNFSSSWNSSKGTIVTTDIDDYTPILIISSPSTIIKNLKIIGNSQSIGIQVINGAYDFNFENIKIKNCDINFDIQDAWTYVLNKCRTEGGRIGFNVLQGTSANFISCVAFNSSEYGFYLNGLTYTSFLSCGSDGSNIGVCLDESNRGVTFSSFGIENTIVCGIKAIGDNVSATFTSVNFGKHNDKEINLIDIDRSIITFTDFKLSSSMSPGGNGKILNITEGSQVVLINPYLFGNVGDIDKCNIIGGNLTNRIKNDINIKTVNTSIGTTATLSAGDAASINYQILTNSTYIITAHCSNGGPQSCTSIISTSNTLDKGEGTSFIISNILSNNVQFSVDSEGWIQLTNNSSNSKAYNWSILKIR